MKRLVLSLWMISAVTIQLLACPVCERNQPKLFRGILHGGGPESKWDYVIVAIIFVISLLTLFYAIKWLIKPGEKQENHIKRWVLKQEEHE